MQTADFTSLRAGTLANLPLGYQAFVPNPLPPDLELRWDLVTALSEADRALAELAGQTRILPNPHLLIGPFIRREAVLSSRIEGTQAGLSDLFFYEAAPPHPGPPVPDVVEVANYVAALEHGLARMADLPMSLRLLREIHERLLRGARGEHMTPGEFRRSQNWIGPPGCTLADAAFVPPPADQMHKALAALETFFHKPSTHPALVRLAMVHYQFEAIHPFLDGNGRIGRLLVSLLLAHEGLLPQPALYLSAYFERNRDAYYRHLLDVSRKGEWEAWMMFFLKGVTEQARDAAWRTGKLLALWQIYRERLSTARASSLLPRLADELFNVPMISAPRAAKLLKVTHRAAMGNIQKLVDAGILVPLKDRVRNRLFVGRDILKIMEMEKGPQDL